VKKIVILVIIVFVIILSLYFEGIRLPNSGTGEIRDFRIEKGQGITTIARNLQQAQIISNKALFEIYVFLNGYRADFYDGDYKLPGDLSLKELVAKILDQRNRTKEIEIKIIEGWALADIDNYLAKNDIIKTGELLAFDKTWQLTDFQKNYPFLINNGNKIKSLEGFLFPDTYRIYEGATIKEIVEKMLDNFSEKVSIDVLRSLKDKKMTVYDIITLSSIIEKEMFGSENRRIIAGIFYNRLESGMALQSDATIDYITHKGTTRPSADDLTIDSQYNTYKYRDLPPGPISSPSLEAIEAAINPTETDFMYFLTTPNNEVIFSKTYSEHMNNQRKYY